MPGFDPALASPFHVDWLVPLDDVTEDDYSRAVAERAVSILRAARYMDAQRMGDDPCDIEVRLWVEAACGSACVSITWEPGVAKFGFHLLDETLRDRLACIVFHDVPSVDADESARQGADLARALGAQPTRRLPVAEGSAREPPSDK